ncbi:MAG: HlyC/CorC family transporter [Proteobacteria bacterium]|nr:HlyC/CorC family transporter [Pseudomonadota bacterium]
MTQAAGGSRPVNGNRDGISILGGLWRWLRRVFRRRNGDSRLRETIEEIIGEIEETVPEEEAATPIGSHERVLLGNILELRRLSAEDVMVPRADIVSVDIETGIDELTEVMSGAAHSRVPVYRENLDDVIGIVHIKDVLKHVAAGRSFELAKILRTVLIVAPSMRALDLLLEMRLSRVHMALVVDEFGGIDGLLTIEDLVEEIVGEIEDEHDVAEGPKLIEQPDGSLIADARATIEEFEERVGPILSEEEREEDIDTLGGLVSYLADRVPTRGELIAHATSGVSFEVMEADPRRVKRLRVRNLPPGPVSGAGDG